MVCRPSDAQGEAKFYFNGSGFGRNATAHALLDLRHLAPQNADAQTAARINEASAAMYVRDGAKDLPMFIARAGLDAEMVNRGINIFVEEALSANAFLDLANHSSGRHGFDFLEDDDRSRSIIAGALTFAKRHLA